MTDNVEDWWIEELEYLHYKIESQYKDLCNQIAEVESESNAIVKLYTVNSITGKHKYGTMFYGIRLRQNDKKLKELRPKLKSLSEKLKFITDLIKKTKNDR